MGTKIVGWMPNGADQISKIEAYTHCTQKRSTKMVKSTGRILINEVYVVHATTITHNKGKR